MDAWERNEDSCHNHLTWKNLPRSLKTNKAGTGSNSYREVASNVDCSKINTKLGLSTFVTAKKVTISGILTFLVVKYFTAQFSPLSGGLELKGRKLFEKGSNFKLYGRLK